MKQCVQSGHRWDGTLAAVLLAISALGLVVAPGCGSRVPSGAVSGKVMLGAEPLTQADVVLCRDDGATIAKAAVASSGEFRFSEPVPVGAYKVQIESTLPIEPPVAGEAREAPKPRYPAKYQSCFTSGLTAEVKTGDNTFTFELK